MSASPALELPPETEGHALSWWQNSVFTLTTFLSAFLLFQVQLIVGKHILPWFGGTAAVWTTSLLVYQLLLLAGYFYSHGLISRLTSKNQVLLHSAVLLTAMFLVIVLTVFWPSAVTPGASWKPSVSTNPALQVVSVILVATGLPFFVLSTTSPLLQGWYARLGGGGQTYRLYAVSNAGSLLALLTFPFILEPGFHLTALGKAWSVFFLCFAGGCAMCARWASGIMASSFEPMRTETSPRSNQGLLTQMLWFLLPACASSLLLASTNLLCQEVTSIPLLWVLPLSVYLITFILCFASSRWYPRGLFQPLFVLGAMATCVPLIFGGAFVGEAALVTITLFSAWMICHGELARLKPGIGDLTSFYLVISAGGAAGGIMVAVIAPVTFNSFIEFQLCLAAVVVLGLICLIRDSKSWIFDQRFIIPLAISIEMSLCGYAARLWSADLYQFLLQMRFYPLVILVGVLAVLGSAMMGTSTAPRKPGFRFVHLTVGFIVLSLFVLLYRSTLPLAKVILSRRNFYGVIQVQQSKSGRILMHGRTLHGAQLNPPYERVPTTYYGPQSGIGIVLSNHPRRGDNMGSLRLGIVGLGAGTIAAYGQPGDYVRFYELDPAVANLSLGAHPVFSFLRDSHAKISVAVGDARLLLEAELARGARQQFDVLVLDAFSGDAIPVHLLTKEAFDTYWQHVNPESGLIAIHISSRHVNLWPVIFGIAKYYETPFVILNNIANDPFTTSSWVMLARRPETLSIQGLGPAILPSQVTDQSMLWTDDRSDVFRLLR